MGTKRRVFISVPDDRHLDERRQQVKRAVISAVASQNLSPVGFEPEQFGTGELVNSEDWTVDKASKLISHCDGAVVLALARTHARILKSEHDEDLPDQRIVSALPTAYNHLEGALALSQRLPVLIVLEENMDRVGIFGSGVKAAIMPRDADGMWVKSVTFKGHLESWTIKVQGRRDVFLGYCSKANSTARGIRDYLESKGFTVLDWARDFKAAGSTILEEIEKAAIQCRCAVFLFTRDDEIPAKTQAKASFDAIPRDNVLLEAGYFTQARGKERVAIIREKGAKMPADLGGIIYLSMKDKRNLLPTKRGLVRFLNDAL